MTILVAGGTGLAGSAIVRELARVNKKVIGISSKDVNLLDRAKTFSYIKDLKPNVIIDAAAKVGGVGSNNAYPVEFLSQNLQIQSNLMDAAHEARVEKFVFLGSSCIYPRNCAQPIKEDYLLTGELEQTNSAYAIAKIAGIKLCESYNRQYKTNYKCLMPSNLFGPNDNYNLQNSHFFSAILRKLYSAKLKKKKIIFWGTGFPRRELTFVDDVAEACIFFLGRKTKHSLINIGSGYEDTIKGFVNFIAKKIKINLKVIFNNDKTMDGTPRKLLDCNIAKKYGWKPKFNFSKAFDATYKDFIKNQKKYLNM